MLKTLMLYSGVTLLLCAATGCQAAPVGSTDMECYFSPGCGSLPLPSVMGGGTLSRRVIDHASKLGLAGVQVRVENISPPVVTPTDATGHYTLQRVPQGSQILVASKPGYVVVNVGATIGNVVVNQAATVPDIEMAASSTALPYNPATSASK